MWKIKLLFLICITVLLGLSSCSEDSLGLDIGNPDGDNPESIELVKKWYANTVKTRSSGNELIYAEPTWVRYAEQEANSKIVLDIDVTDRIKQDFVLENSIERYEETGNYNFRRSYTRLIYSRN